MVLGESKQAVAEIKAQAPELLSPHEAEDDDDHAIYQNVIRTLERLQWTQRKDGTVKYVAGMRNYRYCDF